MRWSKLVGVAVTAALMATAVATVVAQAATAREASRSGGSYVLTATSDSVAKGYAPTFTGNGFLGVRVPAAGQGYAGGTVPAQSELAGFYAKPRKPQTISDAVQQRANIPTWSTLLFGDGTQVFSTSQGTTSAWRQSIDLHTGIVTTSATWRAADGHRARLTYHLFTDRANEHVGVVTLTVTPLYTGKATVTDEIDGSPATLTDETAAGVNAAQRQDYVAVTTQGTHIEAAIASQLVTSSNVTATPTEVDRSHQSIGQQITFPVRARHAYTITKFVGIDDSQDAALPVTAAQSEAAAAAAAGYAATRRANAGAWATLWRGRVDVLGDRTLATDVNASEFYLWSSTRDGVDWSISPAGLSSNGYDGHIFWDAETWMYPTLLAQHPDLAAGMDAYRLDRLTQAQQHAAATGDHGARFPWESALDGTEQIPPPVATNSEGLYEQHITGDIALAQWQYYLVTGDRSWLASQGWPVISGAATFWAGRATRTAGGGYDITHVTGPDEENPDVSDEVYTEVAAKTTLQDAVRAARAIGRPAPASWARIAARLTVPTAALQGMRVHPEFSGYDSQLVKQADVTLLQYPWLYPMPAAVAQNDIDFYVPRSDPGGPSMSDAVNSIDVSKLGTPGCSSFVYTERSFQPFIRDVFHQFSETRTGGAFTFMTGIGGFLQEFLYGYSGLRWQTGAVHLAPSLTGQLGGVVLHDLNWHGRSFDVSIGTQTTTVTLRSGAPLPVSTPSGNHRVTVGHPLRIATARPDRTRTTDAIRCQTATASSARPGAPALAAVDGSPATDWQPASLPASLTAPATAGERTISRATVVWGRQFPPAGPKPNVPPKPGPVRSLRASRYEIQVSSNDRTWTTVQTVIGVGQTTDVLHFAPVRARWVRIRILAASDLPPVPVPQGTPAVKPMPELQELTVSR